MRILNRPMFKYGGPIKEGIMQGMRNGGRAALVGNPVYPKTDGREHHVYNVGLKGAQAFLPRIIQGGMNIFRGGAPRVTGSMSQRATDLYKHRMAPLSNLEKMKSWFSTAPAGKYFAGSPEGRLLSGGAGWAGKAGKGIYAVGKGIAKSPLAVGGLIYAGGKWYTRDGKEANEDEINDHLEQIDIKTDDTVIDPNKAEELAKAAQNKRLQSYLDMMGYDSAKKGALSKALIDASAIVQQGTEEAGSLKEADWSKLINQAIQTTSKRLEKPEQIREAVGLMMTKGEIEKDIAEGKGSALDIQEKYYTSKLGTAGAERKMLNKPTSLAEAVNLTKATDTTGNRTNQALRHYFDGHLVPSFKGKISKKKLDALGGVEDLVTGVKIGLGDGVYQVSNSYIIVKGNEIIGGDDIFATEN